jgi:hypothetical protein
VALPQPRQVWRYVAPGERVSELDIAVGVLLATFGVLLVTKYGAPGPHGGVGAALAVLTMTLPVVWRRRYPVVVAAVLFGGAALNAVAIGSMVRCGPSLPALLLCAFALGRRDDILERRLIGGALLCLLGGGTVQCFDDPNLQPIVMVALAPMIVGLFGIGRLVSSHSTVVAKLARRHDELRRRRLDTAELAAQAERARIAEGLDGAVGARIAEISAAVRQGQSEEGVTSQAFATIEHSGRETLRHMREVVGTLLDAEPPKQPQPGLAELERLVAVSTGTEIRMRFVGIRRPLPPGLELSVYRTVEHLIDAFTARPGGRVAITVDFGSDELNILVRGPAPAAVEQRVALAASAARVALHSGALTSSQADGQWEAIARLPLPVHA